MHVPTTEPSANQSLCATSFSSHTGQFGWCNDAVGPGSSTANHIAIFSGVDGITLADGGHTLSEYALVGQTAYIGTTGIAINRTAAALALTGVSLDNAAAQFYDTSAPTKLVKIDPSNQTAGHTGTIQAPDNGTATLQNGTAALAGQTMYIGTTGVAINRSSASGLSLAGVLLDDSIAQFYNVAAPTKKVKIDPSNQTAGNTGTIQAPDGGTATLVAGTECIAGTVCSGYQAAVVNTVATSSPVSVSGSGYYYNKVGATSACTFNLLNIAAGQQYCFANWGNYHGSITIAINTQPGVTIYYKGAAGTASTGTLVSSGAAGDFICIEAASATEYMVAGSGYGTWTNN